MSEGNVRVVRVGPVSDHPNADRLSVTLVHGGYPGVIARNEFHEGDLAVYVPIDSVVPLTEPRFAHLKEPRVRAARLRGIFSMGLLVRADPSWVEGQDVGDHLGITRYRAPEPPSGSGLLPDPGFASKYDIPGWREFCAAEPPLILPDTEVVATEKLDGQHLRALWVTASLLDLLGRPELPTRLWVGSHDTWRIESADDPF
jgi:RNA ligase (TIGR02306 family)